MYEYRRNLPHLEKSDRAHFITFHTMGYRPLSPKARDLVLACCLYPHGRKCRVHAVVVMPEHVHMLLTPLRDDAGESFTFAEILHPIKSVSAHRINKLRREEGAVWQDESFDHVERSEESLDDKIEYLQQNPVRRGLASRAGQYKWLWVEAFDPRQVPALRKRKT